MTAICLYSQLCIGQTTNISGVVNTYHRVLEFIPAKACVRVSSTVGLNLYKKVLLIQMKGAGITTANNSSFGDTTALNNAGNYEVATICNIIGDSIFMFFNFLNNYTVTGGKVQLVQFGQYSSALVTDTIKATAWNNTTGTGGVIALYISDNLTLNAPVFANAAGFGGGAFVLSSGTCSNFAPATAYIYNASSMSPQNGAYKGENVYDLVVAAETGGRGAPANGGGGGNNHNNGGGGGANLSGGGIGGGNSSTAGCTSNLRGLAGKPLSSWGGKKIFSGGGGGAGHSNGGIITIGGGNGGGIIFIRATNIFGNGYKISANGGDGGSSVSDGAAGGGGAGSVIMSVTNYSGAESIEAKGGNGGNSDNNGNAGRCYGAGGGGSGGVIYFSGAVPPITISTVGGTAGNETERDGGCSAAILPTAGANSSYIENYSYTRSFDPGSYCTAPLPVQMGSFTATVIQQKVKLQWTVFSPEEIIAFEIEKLNSNNQWESIAVVSPLGNTENYFTWDNKPLQGKNLYRLKIVESNNKISFSVIKQVDFDFYTKEFNIYPNPASRQMTVTGSFNSPALLQVFDYSGKFVIEKIIFNNYSVINLSALSPGIYLVRINEKIKKLVVY